MISPSLCQDLAHTTTTQVMRECGALYGRMHALGKGAWFNGEALAREGLLQLPSQTSGEKDCEAKHANIVAAKGESSALRSDDARPGGESDDDWASCT